MLFPYSTDAPIYHWPITTVGLIVINVAVFAATWGAGPEQIEPWILQWGAGLHPLQWISSILKVLSKIAPQQLSENQRQLLGRLTQKAQKLAAEDPYEVADEDW